MPQSRSRDQATIYWMKLAIEVDKFENAKSISRVAEDPSNYTDDFDLLPYTKGFILHSPI